MTEKTASIFDHVHRGYRFIAEDIGGGDARVTITKNGTPVRSFTWPAYKVWNIAAHADDIVDGLERQSDDGLYAAGSLGPFGGNVYSGS